MTDSWLDQGIQAANAGRRRKAVSLLVRALRQDPDDEQAWSWLAAVVKGEEEKLRCWRQVLRINPANQTAVRGVRALTAWLETASREQEPAHAPPAPEAPQEAIRAADDAQRGGALAGAAGLIGRRLAFGVLILLGIIFLGYLGLDMAGGTELGAAANRALARSVAYAGRLLQGDLGLTTAGSDSVRPVPVAEVIVQRLPRSLGLLGISLLFAALLGNILGIWAARGRAQRALGILISTLIGISVPSFFAAFLLQWAVTTVTRQTGRPLLPVGGFGWDNHLILPMLVLAGRPIAQITRIAFLSVREALQQDYARTARSKGLRGSHILVVHVMRNAAIPILTTIGVSLRFSLSSLPVVELYFGWPGVGHNLLKAIAARDDNLTVGLALCLGTLFILVNLILELSYRLMDPRLRETPAKVAAAGRKKPLEAIRSVLDDLWDLAVDNALVNWLRRRNASEEPGFWRLEESGEPEQPPDAPTGSPLIGKRPVAAAILRNFPLTVGGLLVLALVVIVFLGPAFSPNNPYHLQGLTYIDGELAVPPFAPDETYPWGTDALGRGILSLILSGAQQTLILSLLAVAARLLVGVVLGAIAGWTNGSWLDRLILGGAELISAFPTLLLAMILIVALGIRQGMPPFIIALCFVGWGETMQFVRGQVTAIRPQLYIEAAVSVGARTPRIIGRHVLPNLFAALISIVALEMGAVLMLLGELGFISIFIGGGTSIMLPTGTSLYSDVPEWGALLSSIRYLARSYPWTALFPMLAFFVSILSFNLFGEGVRRLLEEGNLIINRIVNRYTVALTALAVIGFNWLGSNSGAMPYYKQQAQEFDGERALSHVRALTDPSMDGRALGEPGMELAAEYIAAHFEALGVQPAGQSATYFQERARSFERLDAVPTLVIEDGGPPLVEGQDYAAYRGPNMTLGEAEGPVRLITLGQLSIAAVRTWRPTFADLDRVDSSGEILLALSDREANELLRVPRSGMLVVADDASQVGRRVTLSPRSGVRWRSTPGETPSLLISKEVADRLLSSSGHTVADLREGSSALGVEEVMEIPLASRVSAEVEGTVVERWPVLNVLGYLPGSEGYDLCADCLGKRLIVVMVQYDSPPVGPGGVFSAANDNASGVAVMLETVRVMQETDYQPFKTFLFVAYSGEGLDGGEPVSDLDVKRYLQSKPGFSTQLQLEAVVQLRGVGGGAGDRLEVSAGGSLRLAELAEQAADQMGVYVVRADGDMDIGVIYDQDNPFLQGGQEAPMVRLLWEGWEEHSRLPTDTLANVSAANLEQAGRSLALTLMVLGRETQY